MIKIVQTGLILKGRYCILERLGSGGEGSVYLARDMELGSVWAVKELPLSEKKEAKLMRLLEHPALPRMVDYVEREDSCFLVMEYIRGKTLGECLREKREFTLEQILSFGLRVADVIDYLHSQNPPVCYGDLKPDNLILSERGKLYLVDLGSAGKLYGKERMTKGTRGYAAPEQYDGTLQKSSDVYALGKTLRELAGKKRVLLYLKNLRFLFFLLRCCQKKPEWRYPDMKAVKQELRTIKKSSRPSKYRGILPILLAVLLVLFTALLYVAREDAFPAALGEVTQAYYQSDFLRADDDKRDFGKGTGDADEDTRKEICHQAEEQLQILLKKYPGVEEQKKLLLLLARNAELIREWEHAALYYEQLLLYQPQDRDGYGAYGCFLLRIGQEEESLRLWESYEQKERDGILQEEDGGIVKKWEEKMKSQDK